MPFNAMVKAVAASVIVTLVFLTMSCFDKKLGKEPKLAEAKQSHLGTTEAQTQELESVTQVLEPASSISEEPKPISASETVVLVLGDGVRLDMVLIPAGEFMMGSDYCGNDAKPVHKVKINQPFYMSVYEITQEQYEVVMDVNPSHFKDSKNPVETVSWHDANKFCSQLSQKTSYKISLPTEAQWEYACRAGSTMDWFFIDDESSMKYVSLPRHDGYQTTFFTVDEDRLNEYACYFPYSQGKPHPVGMMKPNAFGLYDILGNVSEWCQDWYDRNYYQYSPTDDPAGPTESADPPSRVIRGGSWYQRSGSCRSADRGSADQFPGRHAIGFRIVAKPLK